MSTDDSAKKSKEKKDPIVERGKPFGKLLIIMLIGIIGIIVYALQYWDGRQFVQAAGVGAIVAGASMLIGGLLGFLFGIPRSLQQDRRVDRPSGNLQGNSMAAGSQVNLSDAYNQAAIYQPNTNLEQISDWLTKILVGVGLTQVKEILTKLQLIAGGVANGMGIPDGNPAFPLAIILFFLVSGFLFCYLWTRLFLPKELTIADKAAQAAQEAERKADIAILKADVAQSSAALGIGKLATVETGQKDMKDVPAIDINSVDPLRGKFGGKAINNNRQLSAKVLPVPGNPDLFTINLTVSSTNQQRYPLDGEVQFFLHPTFTNNKPVVKVRSGGVAELRLTAWGAFTVGAIADEGATRLELSLADLPDAPLEFRMR